MTRTALVIALAIMLAPSSSAAQGTRLLREPDISDRHVVFVHANDLWVASRDGGEARRLTAHEGEETSPKFSPDGRHVAFSGEYDGNTDVYVVPVEGGEPQRLTWHPGADIVQGWTADGGGVLFRSGRTGHPTATTTFWTVPLSGGLPAPMPIHRATTGELSADGRYLEVRGTSQGRGTVRRVVQAQAAEAGGD